MRKFNTYDSEEQYGSKVNREFDWEVEESSDPNIICGEELQSLSDIISLGIAQEVLYNTAQVNGTFICGSHSDRIMALKLDKIEEHNKKYPEYVGYFD